MTDVVKKKSNAGRPPSAGMSAESIKKKIKHEMTKINRDAANNLPKYFEVMQDYALTDIGSPTNKISACKMFIEMAQNFLKGEEEAVAATEEVVETPPEEAKQVSGGDVTPLSFTERKEQWAAAQAKKKAAYEALKKSKEQAE